MANSLVKGPGDGQMEWREDFNLLDASGLSIFKVPQAGTGEVVVNDGSNDCDFRVESDGNANALFVDAGNGRVGILNGSPAVALDVTGAITASGAITGGSMDVAGTAPTLTLSDSTASAKDLTIKVDADKAQLRESAAGDGTLLVLDLANNRVGVATASPTVALDVTGAAKVSSTLEVTGNITASASVIRASQKRLIGSDAKVGATAGWTVNAASNVGRMATCAASSNAATLVVPLPGLKVGDTLTAFGLIGQIESAGGAVTLDAELRSIQAAAADLTDASVASMTQLSVSADTAVTSANAEKASLAEVIAADKFYYLLITATTAASTDVDLAGAYVVVTEA